MIHSFEQIKYWFFVFVVADETQKSQLLVIHKE